MELNYFDMIASVIILFLGLKGIVNGFFKEVFAFIGIIGGIFVASRFGNDVGKFLNELIFNFENSSAVGFTGFLLTLTIFWIIMALIGHFFKKLSKISGLGTTDRMLGFVFGASKFFLIAAVIAHSLFNIKFVKKNLEPVTKTSFLIPLLVEAGSYIMKLDPLEISHEVNEKVQKTTDDIESKVQKSVNDSTKQIIDEVKTKLKEIKLEKGKDIDI